MDVLKESKALTDWLNGIRHDLHRHPEPSWQEFRTQKTIMTFLESEGIECAAIAGTGVVGLIRGGKPGRTIALRADIDAVKGVADSKETPYSSVNEGISHCCGHDGHVAMQMGAARLLNRIKTGLQGNVKLLFDPAEEGPGGARVMVEEGALENPKVDAVIGPHMGGPKPGHITVKAGAAMAASAALDISVVGPKRAGSIHVQCTNENSNPLYTAGRIMAALGRVQTEFRKPPHTSLVGIGLVQGGVARNTTDKVEIQGTLRTPSNAKRKELKALLPPLVAEAAGDTACEIDFTITDGYPALENDPALCAQFLRSAAKILPPEAIKVKTEGLLAYGSESFAFFSELVPGCYYGLGGAKGTVHGSDYDLLPDALPYGVALQVQAALDFLETSDS